VNAILTKAGKNLARLGPLQVISEQVEQRGMRQLFGLLAGDMAQRRIHLLDDTVSVTHHQDVRHRRQHALDELVRSLKRRVLFFQSHFVLEEIVVDLVHFLDHLDPGLLATRW